MKKPGLLDWLAERHCTFPDNLRLQPTLKWEALGDLYHLEKKEQYPLKSGKKPCPTCWAARCGSQIMEKSGKASSPFPWN